ncbi:MAG: energy-coupling factor ABC transporter ATP-binding protein [Oscillospiraceae bacterium]|nr:energy-coupling factor ABC transporter ATP-binding protein [Oscillospiraceae bacterium]
MIELRDFTLAYPGKEALFAPQTWQLAAGESLALCGDSGAGKSSLLYACCGLIPRQIAAELQGEILLAGKVPGEHSPAERTSLVGMVMQNPETQLFCGTIELEVAFGLENLRVPREEMQNRVQEALKLVGLWARRGEPPGVLSGGQKQLLALASVLVLRPKLLLLDEALSQLDSDACANMMAVLCALRRDGQAMLVVDHDENRRAKLCDCEVKL